MAREGIPGHAMATSTITIDERERLAALGASGVLEAGPDPAYDFLAKLASDTIGTPIAAITLMTADEIVVLAGVGIAWEGFPRDDAVTHYMLENPGPVVVNDLLEAEPFAVSAIAAEPIGLRGFCGLPLVTGDGHVLGAISVADTEPRDFDDGDVEMLTRLADQVIANMERNESSGTCSHGPAPPARRAPRERRKLGVGARAARSLVPRHVLGVRPRPGRGSRQLRQLSRRGPCRRP